MNTRLDDPTTTADPILRGLVIVTMAITIVGVVSYRTGRRDLLLYDNDDPDACREVIRLSEEESDALADLLGAARLTGHLAELLQQLDQTAFPAPEPSFAFQAGDTAVVVGTSAGVRALTTLLDG
jgi:TrkA domain protein